MQLGDFDVVVVGAGFFGATIAERVASQLGGKVCVLDRRPHIGGNAYSEVDPDSGIEVHRYGTHIFHTNSEAVWSYLHRFTEFTGYRHRVFTVAQGRLYSMPINLATISAAFGRVMTPQEAQAAIAKEADAHGATAAQNLEDKAIASVGRTLYDLLIRGYTRKQWQTEPRELSAEIIGRLPVRLTFDDRYFADRYEGMPADGYTAIFRRMLADPNIALHLGVDYFDVADQIRPDQLVVYTGPIDRFFRYRCGELGWRTVDFAREVHDVADFQGAAVINYADAEVPFTRVHEFRHLHPERDYSQPKTTIYREYSRFAGRDDEPYYPINTAADRAILHGYRSMMAKHPNLVFGGRLGSYKYLDMHQAIGAALKTFENEITAFLAERKMPAAAAMAG
ncbi:UDP-galactopyranose mutase [Bradyrhizobium sp. CCGUVB1N3]|uniref:UDP-galactopyranose mutase n=1 Tax=Bradyrhizobium sp. CCGUVB1N3 TaxID=2949629 RepID=UPI0020B35EA6|nr:UDP-galactopyranose mutase [Bradyrhizobium sp. CCGUVB1N3]MCP3469278.1 UDP-galactopyranose mutase [Bradyrhizobium sp. CCGUVB1N3]